jgi:hypothetical protein
MIELIIPGTLLIVITASFGTIVYQVVRLSSRR